MPVAQPSTALASLTRRGFLRSGWPWRSVAYALTTAPSMIVAMVALGLLSLPWIAGVARTRAGTGGVGTLALLALAGAALIVAVGPLVAIPLAGLERLRLRLVDTRPAESGHRRPPAPGLWHWARTRYTEPATWRELGYLYLLAAVAPVVYGAAAVIVLLVVVLIGGPILINGGDGPISLVVVNVDTVRQALPYALAGLALLPAVAYALAGLAGGHAAVARALLDGRASERTQAALIEVSRSRARLVDAFEAERRRIERDLHDGAQQRLVSLTLRLGLAQVELPEGSAAAHSVTVAHDEAKQLMAELRELIHGIHPKMLTDLGLAVALRDRADRCPLPVSMHTDLPRRLPGHVETTAYFVVAEALTNVVKHSGATAAAVTAEQRADVLTVRVVDNGRGGADPERGTGLLGLGDRVAVNNGKLLLSSPPGGPTVVQVELPCNPGTPFA